MFPNTSPYQQILSHKRHCREKDPHLQKKQSWKKGLGVGREQWWWSRDIWRGGEEQHERVQRMCQENRRAQGRFKGFRRLMHWFESHHPWVGGISSNAIAPSLQSLHLWNSGIMKLASLPVISFRESTVAFLLYSRHRHPAQSHTAGSRLIFVHYKKGERMSNHFINCKVLGRW